MTEAIPLVDIIALSTLGAFIVVALIIATEIMAGERAARVVTWVSLVAMATLITWVVA